MDSLKGTVSKERVKKNGEVFTPDEIVNDMIDLVDKQYDNETDEHYINRTILEPSCGNGAILIRVLDRKLGRVENIKQSSGDWEKALLKAVSSIYGIDITPDNVVMTKRRLLEVILTGKTSVLFNDSTKVRDWKTSGFMSEISVDTVTKIRNILDINIQVGNTLTNEKIYIEDTDMNLWTCDANDISESTVQLSNYEYNILNPKDTSLKIAEYYFDSDDIYVRLVNFSDIKNHSDDDSGKKIKLTEFNIRDFIYNKNDTNNDEEVTDYDF